MVTSDARLLMFERRVLFIIASDPRDWGTTMSFFMDLQRGNALFAFQPLCMSCKLCQQSKEKNVYSVVE